MKQLKLKQKIIVRDADGGYTRAQVVAVEPDSTYVKVKWLEARWNLQANIMIARKGTCSTIAVERIEV